MVPTRMAGLLLPLFSIRRKSEMGIGDLAALEEWIDWAQGAKVKFLQLLPVNALGAGDAPSPYSAISSVALEPLYLSLERVPGYGGGADSSPAAMGQLPPRQLPAGDDLVDYCRVRYQKDQQLQAAWKNFNSEEQYAPLRAELEAWVQQEGQWLDDYSTFQVASTFFNTHNWWQWSMQEPDIIRHMVNTQEESCQLKHYHQWVQWLCAREWKLVRDKADAAGVLLMGDVPIGISVASADVFFERHQFDMNWSGGAPAEGNFAEDPFTAKWGQNWGIPLYRWDVMQQDNFSWWSRRIRKMAEIFGMYRIDHILGFYRIYAFPWMPDRNEEFLNLSEDEAAARCDGRRAGFRPHADWTESERKSNLMQGDTLLREIMKKSQGLIVVGEDLGCVPDYVRPNLSQLRIAGFKIPHWEIDDKQQITKGGTYNICSFATYATHDFPPLSMDWNTWYSYVKKAQDSRHNAELSAEEHLDIKRAGKDCERVLAWLGDYAGMGPKQHLQEWGDEVKDKLFTALMQCNSAYTALMWTELFDLPVRLNTPGTEGGRNWRARMGFTAAEAAGMPQTAWLRGIISANER